MNKIGIWVQREWKEVGNIYLLLLLGFFILFILWGCGLLEDRGRLAAIYSAFVALIIAYTRFNVADKRLGIAARREDLDRYMESVKLLCHKEVTLQEAGVRGLRELLESGTEKGGWIAKEAWRSLEIFLQDNWSLPTGGVDARQSRDAVIKALSGTYRKGEKFLKFKFMDLRQAKLMGANLSGADLNGADLGGAILSCANLSGANLMGANLSGANLLGANLSGARLSCANLSGAYPIGADLSEADLSEANLSGADLRMANLSGANLMSANFEKAGGLDELKAFTGICAYRGLEPSGLPDYLMVEVGKNLEEMPPAFLGEVLIRTLNLAEDQIKRLCVGFPRPPISVYREMLLEAEDVLHLAKGAKSQPNTESPLPTRKEAANVPGDWSLVLAWLDMARQVVEEDLYEDLDEDLDEDLEGWLVPGTEWEPVLKKARGLEKAVDRLLSGLQDLRKLNKDDWEEAVRIADSEYRKLVDAVDGPPSPFLEERVRHLLVEIGKMEAKAGAKA